MLFTISWKEIVVKKIIFILAAILFLTTLVNNSEAGNKKLSNQLEKRIEQNTGQIPVIIRTKSGLTPQHEQKVKKHKGNTKKKLGFINSFAAELPVEGIKELAACEDVTNISYDYDVQSTLDVASQSVGASSAWLSGFTGKGVTVAVLDTGIFPHPDLVGNENLIIAFHDIVNGLNAPYDDNGHGTHVAGIIAGNGSMSGSKYEGIAPEADLIGVKVLDAGGAGKASDVLAGIQWVIETKGTYGPTIDGLSKPDLTAPGANITSLNSASSYLPNGSAWRCQCPSAFHTIRYEIRHLHGYPCGIRNCCFTPRKIPLTDPGTNEG